MGPRKPSVSIFEVFAYAKDLPQTLHDCLGKTAFPGDAATPLRPRPFANKQQIGLDRFSASTPRSSKRRPTSVKKK
jgi:hypothetical protein